MYLKVEEDLSLVRDVNSNAILANDVEELHKHRNRKILLKQKDNRIDELTSRVNKLESLIENLLNITNK